MEIKEHLGTFILYSYMLGNSGVALYRNGALGSSLILQWCTGVLGGITLR